MPKDGRKIAIGAGLTAVIVGIILLTAAKKPPPGPPLNSIGDLNDDGTVDWDDVYILINYIVGYPISEISPLSEAEFLRRADVNGDGVVNALDITALETLIGEEEPIEVTWVLPTGYYDPDNDWEGEPAAYDGDTDTYAENWTGTRRWSGFIEFTIPPTLISAIRHWATSPLTPKHCDVDLYYDGAWYDVYENGFGAHWTEVEILGGAKLISKARMRFFNNSYTKSMRFRLHEFEFGKS